MRARVAAGLAALALAIPVAGHAEGGMPQLDLRNPLTLAQVVWMAIIFAVLYFLLRGWGLPRVERVLAERDATINADLDAARAASTRANDAAREVAQSTARARAEAQGEVNAAIEAAKRDAAARAEVLDRRLDDALAEAEARIAASRAEAMAALRGIAREAAEAVLTRLTGRAADTGALDAALGESLAARGQG